MIISKEDDCSKLYQGNWHSITVLSGFCNSLSSDLVITNNSCLQSMNIQAGSLQNLNSFVISENPYLTIIFVGSNGCSHIHDFSITSTVHLEISLSELPLLSIFNSLEGSFSWATSVSLSGILQYDLIMNRSY